jgi:hypothetical protein
MVGRRACGAAALGILTRCGDEHARAHRQSAVEPHACNARLQPSGGCGADFHIDPRFIGGWIDGAGEDAARLALSQLDDLIARGRAIEEGVGVQRSRMFRPPGRGVMPT